MEKQLSILADPDTPLDERLKAYRIGMKRLKKTKKQINTTVETLNSFEPLVAPPGDNYHWNSELKSVEESIETLESVEDLDQLLDLYRGTRETLATLEQFLEQQQLSIEKVDDDFEELRLVDLTTQLVKPKASKSDQTDTADSDEVVGKPDRSKPTVEDSEESVDAFGEVYSD